MRSFAHSAHHGTVKEITYAGARFVTGDLIANALLDLVEKLGTATATMTVEIPAFDGDRQSARLVDFVIGPSSEIVAAPIDSEHDEIVDDSVVDRLHQLAHSVQLAHPVAADPDEQFDSLDLPGTD